MTAGTQERSIVGTVMTWTVVFASFGMLAYMAWFHLLGQLWNPDEPSWWYWILAVIGTLFLLIAPFLAFTGAWPVTSLAAGRARQRPILCWSAYLGIVALVGLLLLWFLPRPEWWSGGHHEIWFVLLLLVLAVIGAGAHMFLTVYEVGERSPREDYVDERAFNHGDKTAPPGLGLAMSGGGIRSAAFNIGVLQALHRNGVLKTVDVMSSVSGGSYAMSWFFLQPYYTANALQIADREFDLNSIIDEMFDSDGRFQRYLSGSPKLIEYLNLLVALAFDLTVWQPMRAIFASMRHAGQYNRIGTIREDYRESIQKLFHGLPSKGSPGKIENQISSEEHRELNRNVSDFTRVKPVRYQELAVFAKENGLPFFIFNTALLVDRSHRHMLWPTAFELSAHGLGSDVSGHMTWNEFKEQVDRASQATQRSRRFAVGGLDRLQERNRMSQTGRWMFMSNLAPAISGAAVGLSQFDPKRSSREMKLRTWTPFIGNLDLGYVYPREPWDGEGMMYLSDGGHSENLGAYALIKRECRRIVIVDAEHEASIPYVFSGYSKLKRQLEEEQGLCLSVTSIDEYLAKCEGPQQPTQSSLSLMEGSVTTLLDDSDWSPIKVFYIKLGMERHRLESYPETVASYALKNDKFPQDPTTDQTFGSEQFVAYRDLGYHVAKGLSRNALMGSR